VAAHDLQRVSHAREIGRIPPLGRKPCRPRLDHRPQQLEQAADSCMSELPEDAYARTSGSSMFQRCRGRTRVLARVRLSTSPIAASVCNDSR